MQWFERFQFWFRGTVPVPLRFLNNNSDGSDSAFCSWENGSDGSSFPFWFGFWVTLFLWCGRKYYLLRAQANCLYPGGLAIHLTSITIPHLYHDSFSLKYALKFGENDPNIARWYFRCNWGYFVLGPLRGKTTHRPSVKEGPIKSYDPDKAPNRARFSRADSPPFFLKVSGSSPNLSEAGPKLHQKIIPQNCFPLPDRTRSAKKGQNGLGTLEWERVLTPGCPTFRQLWVYEPALRLSQSLAEPHNFREAPWEREGGRECERELGRITRISDSPRVVRNLAVPRPFVRLSSVCWVVISFVQKVVGKSSDKLGQWMPGSVIVRTIPVSICSFFSHISRPPKLLHEKSIRLSLPFTLRSQWLGWRLRLLSCKMYRKTLEEILRCCSTVSSDYWLTWCASFHMVARAGQATTTAEGSSNGSDYDCGGSRTAMTSTTLTAAAADPCDNSKYKRQQSSTNTTNPLFTTDTTTSDTGPDQPITRCVFPLLAHAAPTANPTTSAYCLWWYYATFPRMQSDQDITLDVVTATTEVGTTRTTEIVANTKVIETLQQERPIPDGDRPPDRDNATIDDATAVLYIYTTRNNTKTRESSARSRDA